MRRFFMLAIIVALALPAAAHVVVRPSEAPIGTSQTFTVGVPNERDVPTIEVRLAIPEGVGSVMPFVKAGWEVQIVRAGDSVTELVWTGGSVPVDMRDEFSFRARVPAQGGELVWKAYQTYADGVVVAWDKAEDNGHGHGNGDAGPASKTAVVNDLRVESLSLELVLSGAALVLSVLALVLGLRRRRT